MSIVNMQKVTFIGMTADRDRLLADLQTMGCVQIIPLASASSAVSEVAPSAGAREALKFLQSCPQRRRQVLDTQRFDPVAVEQRTLEVRNRLNDLKDERDFLIKRIQDMRPWGEFVLSPLTEMDNRRLWFYVVPHQDLPKIEAAAAVWEVIRRDNRFCYVVVVSEEEPTDMPVPRVHLGYKPRHELVARLDEVEFAIEDAQAERAYLTRWLDLFNRDLNQLEDRATCLSVARQAYTNDLAFALQGWAPAENVKLLEDYSKKQGFLFEAQASGQTDNPPTLMQNPPWIAAGEDLVTFYMTPGYRTWDPSSVIFVSFALFFAMILSDAGYATVMGLVLILTWKKMGRSSTGRRFRPLSLAVVSASLLFGVLVGSYFGVTPADNSWLGKLHLLDMSDTNQMMFISVVIGILHIVFANMMDAYRYPHWQDRMPAIGWIGIICGGFALAMSGSISVTGLKELGITLMVLGALFILWFSAPREKPLARLAQGLLGLTHISAALGDVLSYLRLFALGLASGSLAVEFNHMAAGIHEAYPGIGLFFALLVLVLGHAVNLFLGITSGVIHGLRLNVIEFFNWGLKEEGTLYKPFKRSEDNLWNR